MLFCRLVENVCVKIIQYGKREQYIFHLGFVLYSIKIKNDQSKKGIAQMLSQ